MMFSATSHCQPSISRCHAQDEQHRITCLQLSVLSHAMAAFPCPEFMISQHLHHLYQHHLYLHHSRVAVES